MGQSRQTLGPGAAATRWLIDLDSRLGSPRPRPRLAYSRPRPRPRPRLWGSKTKTKTLMSKTKTETQDSQDQYWKSMTEMDCDKQKDWKVMASRKSSILIVAHSKQQNIIPCLTTVLFIYHITRSMCAPYRVVWTEPVSCEPRHRRVEASSVDAEGGHFEHY